MAPRAEKLRVLPDTQEGSIRLVFDQGKAERQQANRHRCECENRPNRSRLRSEQAPASSEQEASVIAGVVVPGKVSIQQVRPGKRCNGQHAPDARHAVDGDRIQGVVHLAPEQCRGTTFVGNEAYHADNGGGPEIHQRGRCRRARGDDGVCGNPSGDLDPCCTGVQRRRRIEGDPANEEEEHSDVREGRAVPAKLINLHITLFVSLVEAQRAWADNAAGGQRGGAARQVDHAGAGEVHEAQVLGEPAVFIPGPPDDVRVGFQRHPLRNGARHDGGRRGGEAHRVVPGDGVLGLGDAEVMAGRLRRTWTRDAEADHKPSERAEDHVVDVLEHDALGMLAAHAAHLQ
eukprot:scaffold63_cov306-Pinguiococcus_pyrenoidosus.AAC.9